MRTADVYEQGREVSTAGFGIHFFTGGWMIRLSHSLNENSRCIRTGERSVGNWLWRSLFTYSLQKGSRKWASLKIFTNAGVRRHKAAQRIHNMRCHRQHRGGNNVRCIRQRWSAPKGREPKAPAHSITQVMGQPGDEAGQCQFLELR